MRLRVSVFAVCVVMVCVSGLALFAKPVEIWVCCSSNDDCRSLAGTRCCDPFKIDMPACSQNDPGYCLVVCEHPSGTGGQ